MPVYSMTGYASAQHSTASSGSEVDSKTHSTSRLGLEIRSVNSRFLDLTFKLPEELRQHEPALREQLVRQLKRGKVEVRASIESTAQSAVTDPSSRLLQRLNSLQDTIKVWLPDASPLSVADVMRLSSNEASGTKDWEPHLLPVAQTAVEALIAARERGAHDWPSCYWTESVNCVFWRLKQRHWCLNWSLSSDSDFWIAGKRPWR